MNSEKPLEGNDKLVVGIFKECIFERKQNFGNENFIINKENFEKCPTIKLRNF